MRSVLKWCGSAKPIILGKKVIYVGTVSSERNSIFIHEYIFTNLIQNWKYVYCKYDRNEWNREAVKDTKNKEIRGTKAERER